MAIKKTHEEFLAEVNNINNKITILDKYTNVKTKILCECKVCNNKWYVIPNKLLQRRRCPKCSRLRVKQFFEFTNDNFLQTLSNVNSKYKNKFISVVEDYKGYDVKITCKCNVCNNTWKTTPNSLLVGYLVAPNVQLSQ